MSGRVLITGGGGYVGRFIARTLREAGWRVVVSSRGRASGAVASHPAIPLVLSPNENYRERLDGYDAVVHAAFEHRAGRYRGGEGDDPDGFRDANLGGTLQLMTDARTAGVRCFIFLSSRAVYGERAPGEILFEDDLASPTTLYGDVKLTAEQAIAASSDSKFSGVSLRITGVYGAAPCTAAHKWTALFDDFLENRAVDPRAATEVHGQDVANAIVLLLTRSAKDISGEVYNVSDLVIDRRDILAPLKKKTQSTRPLPSRGDEAALNVMNCDKLKALGWRPGGRRLFETTLAELVDVHLSRGGAAENR